MNILSCESLGVVCVLCNRNSVSNSIDLSEEKVAISRPFTPLNDELLHNSATVLATPFPLKSPMTAPKVRLSWRLFEVAKLS